MILPPAPRNHSGRKPLEWAAPAAVATMLMLSAATETHAAKFELPEGPNRNLIYAKCRTCHDLQYLVESKGMNAIAWDGLLDDMEGFGVDLTPDERDKIYTYLSTYMADTPPPAPTTTAAADEKTADGEALFMENCTSCHQEDAQGIEETFPPLAGNNDLFLAETFPVKVLLHGMVGTINVNGQNYEGEMPAFDVLEDGEIAALVNYLRNNFGNDASAHDGITPVTADMVSKLRSEELDPDQIHAYRETLK